MAEHIYVSFSPSDGAYVQQLIFHLTTAGLTVWTEQQGSAAEHIADGAAFVPVVSPHSVESEDIEREIGQAKAAYRPILPLVLAGGQPPASLAGFPVEDVTGGQMPPPHFVEQLRRLAAAAQAPATGQIAGTPPGVAPPKFTDAVPVTPKKSRRGLVIGIVLGVVALIVVCVGAALVLGLTQLNKTSAENAAVGDCLSGNTEGDALDASKVRRVDCGSAEATLKVTARIENKKSAEGEAACGKDADFVFWSGPRAGEPGTVLCLQRL
jgi:hypothetical protein